jgi:hypothetical protein
MNGVEIVESFFSGTVEGSIAGGIVGRYGMFSVTDPNTIAYCYSAGTVKGIHPSGQAFAGGIAGLFNPTTDPLSHTIEASYSIATVTCESNSPTNSGYAGGITGMIGSYDTITDCLALNPSISGIGSPLSTVVQRVVAYSAGTGLSGNKARNGLTPTGTYTSDIGATGKDGETLANDPPQQTDFAALGDYFWTLFFDTPPSGWTYSYPVFQWQIEKGIQP